MKPRLQAALAQNLVMTPQLQQALRLLQLSTTELEAELAEALQTNPLLEWADDQEGGVSPSPGTSADGQDPMDDWTEAAGEQWREPAGSGTGDEGFSAAEQVAGVDTLHDHLLWQLHLDHFSPRDRAIGVALIEAIDDDGYLREPLDSVAVTVGEPVPDEAELLAVLHRIQRFDPIGVGARSLGESLSLQLDMLDAATPGRDLAARLVAECIERLPRLGVEGVATLFGVDACEAATAIDLLRSLDPRPGARIGPLEVDTYVAPDVIITRRHGTWHAALANEGRSRLRINRVYEGMLGRASASDASYLRGCLQEARWLLKNIEARGETLLRVTRYLVRCQSAFLDSGDAALRPLTLREVAGELGLHESTISRAITRKFARTPHGTLPLRAFFASGVGDGADEASSTAVQAMIRRLVEAEDPRRPLSDARLTEMLQAAGVPVARRTVAKYREAAGIPSSPSRLRMG